VRPAKVKWFDWTEEAFRKAEAEDKPIVLSISATWCHGCRVMDETTYSDDDVAGVLNSEYVPIRVDSDRRPDLNERYNLGGWPTTAFLTPSGGLLGGTTYVDPAQMKQLLAQLKSGYAVHKHRLGEEIARRDAKIAQVRQAPPAGLAALSMEVFRKTIRGIVATFDPAYGGFGQAPRFPLVASLRVVLQALYETDGPDFRQVLTKTLDAMADRGMYDHEDGGFFHYAINDLWTVARFEKIAEDNAGLIRLYLDASLVSGQEKCLGKALHALVWAKTRLWDEERGVFYGSQAADEDYYIAVPKERAKRTPPPVDRTLYTPACAAMASAFLRAAEVTGDASLAETGKRALESLLGECVRDGEVAHYHDGQPRLFLLARDAIVLGEALLDAYDHTGERRFLEQAEDLAASLTTRFWSAEEKGIVDRLADPAERGEAGRPRKSIQENALAAAILARLWRHGAGDHHRDQAERLLLGYPDFLDGYGHLTAEYALAADWLVRPPTEIQAGPGRLKPYVPRRVILHGIP
jgi:uncharacterized protein YyaL (SSP411 family)